MILPDFVLTSSANQRWLCSGIDSLEHCKDPSWFNSYPWKIEYVYNSRGFRDQEWPESLEELKSCIWCLGDSFTVGIGNPASHTWPCLLEKATKIRTINVSMDGASNAWIHRRAVAICENIQPKIMVVHWSYVTRDEIPDANLSDEQRRLHYNPELLDVTCALRNFKKLVLDLENAKLHTRIIHSFIPEFVLSQSLCVYWNKFAGPDWPAFPSTVDEFDKLPSFVLRELQEDFGFYDIFRTWCEICQGIEHVPQFDRLDLARDGHHYDLATAQDLVSKIHDLLNI